MFIHAMVFILLAVVFFYSGLSIAMGELFVRRPCARDGSTKVMKIDMKLQYVCEETFD